MQDRVSEIPSALCSITLEIRSRAGQEPGDRRGLGARSFWTFAVEAMRGATVQDVQVMAGVQLLQLVGVVRSCFTKSPLPTLSTGAKAYKGNQVAGQRGGAEIGCKTVRVLSLSKQMVTVECKSLVLPPVVSSDVAGKLRFCSLPSHIQGSLSLVAVRMLASIFMYLLL